MKDINKVVLLGFTAHILVNYVTVIDFLACCFGEFSVDDVEI